MASPGLYYPPPPVFTGGRQPYAPAQPLVTSTVVEVPASGYLQQIFSMYQIVAAWEPGPLVIVYLLGGGIPAPTYELAPESVSTGAKHLFTVLRSWEPSFQLPISLKPLARTLPMTVFPVAPGPSPGHRAMGIILQAWEPITPRVQSTRLGLPASAIPVFLSALARTATALIEGGSMKKNVAGQAIGAQMISVSTGADFTGAVTIFITGDSGTQSVGTVAAGACTHEGLGYHSYAPAQAETNYDHIAFTFTGTGAVTQTIELYTTFPQTGDNFSRLSSWIALGTVDTGGTTTSIPTSSLAPSAAVTDQFKGRIVIFSVTTTTTALRGQATDITASSSGGVLTVTALTTAPVSGDTFVIV